MISIFRERGFALLWIGQFLVILAVWSLRIVLLIWVYQLTGSGLAVSLVGLAEAIPLLLMAPVAGVFVDRWNRAHAMVGSVLANALLILPLLAVTGRAGMPVILAIALLANAAGQLFLTAATAALPVVVGQERIGQANGLLSLLTGGIAVIGPGAAALLYGAVGPHGAVVAVSLLLVLAAPVLAVVPAPKAVKEEGESTSVASEAVAGLRYVRRSPLLVALVVIVFIFMLGFGALSVLDVVFVTRALHLPSQNVGVLLSSSGIGELVGGIVVSVISAWMARRYHRLIGIGVIVCGLGFLVYAFAQALWFAVGALFVVGLMFPPIVVSFMTLLQLATEDAFMGRVNSVINTGMAVATIASVASGGALTDLFGVRQVIGGAAALLILSGAVSLLLIRSTPVPRATQMPVLQAAGEVGS